MVSFSPEGFREFQRPDKQYYAAHLMEKHANGGVVCVTPAIIHVTPENIREVSDSVLDNVIQILESVRNQKAERLALYN